MPNDPTTAEHNEIVRTGWLMERDKNAEVTVRDWKEWSAMTELAKTIGRDDIKFTVHKPKQS